MLLPTAASAQSMSAETFFQKAKALQRKGMKAMFSSDVKQLMKEAKAAGETARAERLAALKPKLQPRYCPPPGAQRIGSDEFMQRLGALSRTDRLRIDMTEAMIRIMESKFPCR
ncbi:MAG: hypothetical protein LH610_07990 [Sphingomonas bacterium]|nr:hypothetical protein [Sphingomonas bacterium]